MSRIMFKVTEIDTIASSWGSLTGFRVMLRVMCR